MLGTGQVRELLAEQEKAILVCSNRGCGKRFNLEAYRPENTYRCRACGSRLAIPVADADEATLLEVEAEVGGSGGTLLEVGTGPDRKREESSREDLPQTMIEKASRAAGRDVTIRLTGAPRIEGKGTFGRYASAEELARGGMGAIYRAIDPELGRPVAIKSILAGELARNQEVAARFLREAQVTGQLQHPNIPPVHELSRAPGGELYFTMKLIEGRSLEAVVRELVREGPQALTRSRNDLLRSLVKVCDALAYAHSRGVVHRDLKPANIMVGAFGEVLVMDWGIAKVLGCSDIEAGAPIDRFQTIDGAVMGTPSYMSPEQADGRVDEIDPRSDVYSLGAVLYEILTGSPPYLGKSVHQIRKQIQEGRLEPPSRRAPEAGIPSELDRLVEKALASKPARRYASVDALREDLEAHLAERPISAYRYSAWGRARKWVRRNRAVSAIAATSSAVILAFVAALAVFAVRASRGEARAVEELANRLRLEAEAEEASAEIARRRAAEETGRIALADAKEASSRERAYAIVQRLLVESSDATSILPVRPERTSLYDRWQAEADAVLAGRSGHAEDLAHLEAIPAPTAEDRSAAEMARAILLALEELALASRDVERYAQIARELETPSSAWPEAIRSIQLAHGGLTMRAVPGLVPLGPDPESGYWEFEHVATAGIAPSVEAGQPMSESRGIVLVLVPGGRFRMGSPAETIETPEHDVDVRPFLLAKYELTWAQWRRATLRGPRGGIEPAEGSSWNESSLALSGLGLRLPSEAEWEYAARGGTTTCWWTGDDAAGAAAAGNFGGLEACPVGRYRANPFGLFDTIGNVWEWCQDTLQPDYSGAPADGSAWERPGSGMLRVGRGGCYANRADDVRSANRDGYAPTQRSLAIGIRAAMTLPR